MTQQAMKVWEELKARICNADGTCKPKVKRLIDMVKQSGINVTELAEPDMDILFEALLAVSNDEVSEGVIEHV